MVAAVKTSIAIAWCSNATGSGAAASSVQMPSAACNVSATNNATAPANAGPLRARADIDGVRSAHNQIA